MSENIDPEISDLTELIPEILKIDTQKNIEKLSSITTNNTNIFDLINDLNENGQKQQQSSSSVLSSTPTDSQSQITDDSQTSINPKSHMDLLIMNSIEPISSENVDLETSQSSENSSSASIETENKQQLSNSDQTNRLPRTRIPVGLPRPRLSSATNQNNNKIPATPVSTSTKTSRIAVFSRPKPPTETSLPPSPIQPVKKIIPTTSTTNKKPNYLSIEAKNLQKTLDPRTSPRSFSRDVATTTASAHQKTSKSSITDQKTLHKRGTSLAATNSISSLNTSFSGADVKNKKNASGNGVRLFTVRHKPRQSKVKIFSQKVEISKNVTSKIGSLENYDYKPAGGDVVIETKALNWNAQSKINSLETANYVPPGGNVKIESHKLNWEAKSKIGSLEKAATYKPHGGNVKIETHKLSFKARARPKTDTGLVYMEDPEETEDYMNNTSQCVSVENLNDTRDYSS